MAAAEMFLQTMGSLAQFLNRCIHKDRPIIISTDAVARNNLLCEFCNTVFSHEKIPAL